MKPEKGLNDKQKEGLSRLLYLYPVAVSKGTGLHLSTAKSLERLGYVKTAEFWETIWRGGVNNHGSERMWTAELTPEGIQEALRLGYKVHEPGRCFLRDSCEIHTPGHPAALPMPTLEARGPQDVQESLPGLVLPEDTAEANRVIEAYRNHLTTRPTVRLEDVPGLLKPSE
ncbi:hypothetical protein [Streptomyces sp. NPDC057363]|uniref:hypothetical protein n=1 Tax=Streptomyces sp. NPDC057363 TaxID=3346107 RepID=UPI003636492F